MLRKQSLWRAVDSLGFAAPLVERLLAERFAEPRRPPHAAEPYVHGRPEHRFGVALGDDELAVWDWGEGPTVLLVHGWNGSAAQMAGFVQPLVDAGYHVVAFDQPGHGLSGGTRANLLDLAEAVRAVAARVQHVHAIVAHSLGATASVLAIAQGLEVGRAVLYAPPAEVAPFVRGFARGLGLSPARADGVLARVAAELGGDLGALALDKLAPRVRTPLLILHDPDDRSVPFAHGRAVADAAPDARLVRLRGLGHAGALVNRPAIARAVDFVAGIERRALVAA
jgi:pimeloyl-ACP methyl ester carboxylesterase